MKRHPDPAQVDFFKPSATDVRKALDPDPPAQAHSETSVRAANEIRSVAKTQRARVRALLRELKDGLTDEEIYVILKVEEPHVKESSWRARRVELVGMSLVRDSGRTRKTASGRDATIWEAVKIP